MHNYNRTMYWTNLETNSENWLIVGWSTVRDHCREKLFLKISWLHSFTAMILPKQLEHADHAEHMQNLFEFFQKRLSLDKAEILPRVRVVASCFQVAAHPRVVISCWFIFTIINHPRVSEKTTKDSETEKPFLKIGWLIARDFWRQGVIERAFTVAVTYT